jgi:hypothetical protein
MSKRNSSKDFTKDSKKRPKIIPSEIQQINIKSDVMSKTLKELEGKIKEEVIYFNQKKLDIKKHYTKIQQLRGAFDVLQDLSKSYSLVPKNSP